MAVRGIDYQGREFHGEFSSADASALSEANSRFTLYDTGKNAITLAATERVVITDLFLSVGATAQVVQAYDGADNSVGNGERIAQVNLPVNGSFTSNNTQPHFCALGTYPKIKTGAAGQVDGHIKGVIAKG